MSSAENFNKHAKRYDSMLIHTFTADGNIYFCFIFQKNKDCDFMRIVCWQMIHMKSQVFFSLKNTNINVVCYSFA